MKFTFTHSVIVGLAFALLPKIEAGVVINEVFYNAPNELSDLEYIELHNVGDTTVDLSGWRLTKGIKFTFPKECNIAPGGFLVVCKDAKVFSRFYEDVEPLGAFEKSLSNGSDKINLKDAAGKTIDSVEYSDEFPWPVSADGYSASLERICPTVDDDSVANWAPSVLSSNYDADPAGTPGKRNSVFQETFPPVIKFIEASVEEVARPGTEIAVKVSVEGARDVALLYQVIEPGASGTEVAVKMAAEGVRNFAALIPGQSERRIVRYRIRATSESGAVRHFPAENEIRPARSVYVSEPIKPGVIPVAHFFNVGEKEFERGAAYQTELSRPPQRSPGGFGRGFRGNRESPEDRARRQAEQRLSDDALSAAWEALTLMDSIPAEKFGVILPAFRKAHRSMGELREGIRSADDIEEAAKRIDKQVSQLRDTLIEECSEVLDAEQLNRLATLGNSEPERGGRRGRRFDPALLMRRFLNLEQTWFQLSMNAKVTQAQLVEVRRSVVTAIEKRDSTTLETNAEGFPDFEIITQTVQSQQEGFFKELKATLGEEMFGKLGLDSSASNFGPGRSGRQAAQVPLRPQGSSALVYTDPETRKTRLFDFINIVPRKSGYKVRLHKDRTLDGMGTINVIFESDEATCINEALAFDLYRAAGNAGQRAGFLRLAIDGNLVGYHLWFEQANGAFFRHNDIDDNGNLYKVTWQGGHDVSEFTPEDKRPKRRQDIVRRYEKKSNPHDGYDDLIELVEALEQAEGDDEMMWQLIEERFDVENAVNYYAVNSLLSHWDGFFNNYFLYHDTKRNKWMLFPFDQDSTWSQRMGDVESLSTMPLNYGSADAVRGGFGRGGNAWWRDGGEISKPLLSNTEFNKRFQSRLNELAKAVFNKEDFGQRIGNVESMLKDEVMLRAAKRGSDGAAAQKELARITASLREHLNARRQFILNELQ